MTTKTKNPRPRVGDKCWFVEWCYELAFYDNSTDVDHDRCKEYCERVATKEEAEKLAREVYPQTIDKFGVVSYAPHTFIAYDEDDAVQYPHAGFWECTADAEYYDGPDA